MKMVRNFHKLRPAIHFALLEDEAAAAAEDEDKAGPRSANPDAGGGGRFAGYD